MSDNSIVFASSLGLAEIKKNAKKQRDRFSTSKRTQNFDFKLKHKRAVDEENKRISMLGQSKRFGL
ncbi:MAG TPA: hypothetical protein VJ205_00895 [Gammaproteobacteria bacterium]|nr:hypothetical protein [Gammaproteobacteria bacterium]